MKINIKKLYAPVPRRITIDLTAEEFEALRKLEYICLPKSLEPSKMNCTIMCENNRQIEIVSEILSELIYGAEEA